jgi:membrane associated rhomboid family serine protease
VTQRSEPTVSEPIFNVPAAVIAVIAVCVFVHVARTYALTREEDVDFLINFAFIPARYDHALALQLGIADGWGADVWTFVTYAFIHGDIMHLGVNTVWLLPFGAAVARRFGSVRFLAFFAVTAAAGALAHLITHPGGEEPVIGASAAISGYMAAATRFAFQRGGPLGLIRGGDEGDYHVPAVPLRVALRDMRIVVFLVAWFGLNIVFGLGSIAIAGIDQQAVAWQAHIGGFLAGLLLFPFFDPIVAVPPPVEHEASDARETSVARETSAARDGNGGETPPTLH